MIEKGFNYLIYEEKTDATFKLFAELVAAGSPGLCITTLYPAKLKKMYKMGDTKILWLSDSKDEPGALSPTRLDFEITRELTRFIKDQKDAVILMDGFGYLTLENEFDKVRKFIKRTNDLASMNQSTFIVVVNPNAFSKETVTTLSRDFDKVEDIANLSDAPKPAAPAAPQPRAPESPAPQREVPQSQPVAAQMQASHVQAASPTRIEYKGPPLATSTPGADEIEIEDIYLIHRATGTLIQRRTWRDNDLIDPDLIGGMFQAILDFINNSFAAGEISEFSRIEVKGYIILIGDGEYISLAMVFSGKVGQIINKAIDTIKDVMRKNIQTVEKNFGPVLGTYDGDVEKLRGTRKLLDQLAMDINKALEPQFAEMGIGRKVSQMEQHKVNEVFGTASQLARQGKYAEALKKYDEALAIDPNNLQCLFNKGVILQMSGQVGDAISCYDKLIQLNPKDPETWSNKGIALRGIGKTQEAIDCYRGGLELNPRDATLWSNLGIALRNIGRIKESLEAYDTALSINPNDASVWSNKGVVLGSMGLLKEAIECYDKALSINPGREMARKNREIALKELQKRGQA
jgi:tetratricopeptide (TPR) repeat protein